MTERQAHKNNLKKNNNEARRGLEIQSKPENKSMLHHDLPRTGLSASIMESRLLTEYRNHYSYLLWRRTELERYMERTLRDIIETYRAAGVKAVIDWIL